MAQIGLIMGYAALGLLVVSVVLLVVFPVCGCGICGALAQVFQGGL